MKPLAIKTHNCLPSKFTTILKLGIIISFSFFLELDVTSIMYMPNQFISIGSLWPIFKISFSSVQFSSSVISDPLWLHELQHARPLCPSPTPGVYPNSCPLSWWCHPTILSSVVSFSSCPQSFPASGSFQMSQFFASGGQSIGVSASASVLQWIFRIDLL